MTSDNFTSWRVMGAGISGTSHADGQSQDAHAWQLANGWLLLVASDGVGSEPLSALGSKLAVSTVLDAFSRDVVSADLDQDAVRQWIGEAHRALAQKAAADGQPVHSFGCTLLVLAANGEQVICGQVGDGYCVGGDVGGYRLLVDPVDLGATNLTHTLTDPAFAELVRTASDAAPRRVALLTDGLDMHSFDNEAGVVYAPFFDLLFPHLEASGAQDDDLNTRLASYLESDVVAALSRDDKTLLLATRADSHEHP